MSLPAEALAVPEEVRERVRAALLELRRTGAKVTLAALQGAAGVKRAHASTLLGLHRAGKLPQIDAAWTDPPPVLPTPTGEVRPAAGSDVLEELADAIEKASTAGAIGTVAGQIASLALKGLIPSGLARCLRDLLQERRRSITDAIEQDPPAEDPTRILLASEAAMKAARAVDLYVSDARRERVLAFLAAELEADALEHPNVDCGGAA